MSARRTSLGDDGPPTGTIGRSAGSHDGAIGTVRRASAAGVTAARRPSVEDTIRAVRRGSVEERMAAGRRTSIESVGSGTRQRRPSTERGGPVRRGSSAQGDTSMRRGSSAHGDTSSRRGSNASSKASGRRGRSDSGSSVGSEDQNSLLESGGRHDKLAARRARTNMHKVAGATEILATLKKKGISVKKNELAAIQDVLQKANEKNMAADKELAALNERTRNQEAQIEFLTMQLEGVKSGMHSMRLDLEAAKSREDQLLADLATAGELTKEISRLEAQLSEERMRTLGIMDQLKEENLEVGNDRRRLRQEREQAMEEAATAKAEAAASVEGMRTELRTEEARRRNLSRDYEHVSRWMTLVASGRTTWQPGRMADKGSVVEAMTAGRAETVWSRGCANWMSTIDVADVMRDDFWLGQVEEQAKGNTHSGEATVSGIRPVELQGLEGPEGRAGAEPLSAAARAAARAYMSSNMEAVVGLLQRHRSSLRHCFLSYCKSWPFGISSELLASCSHVSSLDDNDVPAAAPASEGAPRHGAARRAKPKPPEKFTAPAATLLESGMSEATDGGMTMPEFWRLVQDLGMAHTILNRDDSDLIFLRSNKAIYDREAFYRAVAGNTTDGGMPDSKEPGGAAAHGAVGGREAESWVQKFQTLDIAMNFAQFCEAIVRLAVLHVPRKPWDGRVAQSLKSRIEFFLTKNLYPAAMAEVSNQAQHSTAQHSTAQHSTAQHSTAQHGTARHGTAVPPATAGLVAAKHRVADHYNA